MTDAEDILELYAAARALQSQKGMVVWPSFDRAFIEVEIQEGRQWKIVVEDQIACNWTISFEDKDIWGERDKADSVFIHRICTNPEWRGRRYIDAIVAWATKYAIESSRKFVRLDTLGNNVRLIEHYTSAGFRFLGIFRLTDTARLPTHYQREPNCCLFEISVE